MRKPASEEHIFFVDSGDFLKWWLEEPRLDGDALDIFRRYYSNYEGRFAGYLESAWTDRHQELERAIEGLRGRQHARVMDLGCGTGSVALYMAWKLKGDGEVLGVDIRDDRLFCARERQKVLEGASGFDLNCRFLNSNVLCLEDDRGFDFISLEEAFHHMEPRLEVVKKISALLKKRGVLIISEVNACNPLMQVRLFLKRGFRTVVKRTGEDGVTHVYGNERILRAGRTAEHFRPYNMQVESLRYFRIFGASIARWMSRAGLPVLDIEERLCKLAFFARIFSVHYNIVLQKPINSFEMISRKLRL
ncbi:MAG: methyltransferase domain-containing protein [Deltaproteobacteria bacterium]|nr:methyltransferase domain-containing protein [Deltaproteobacteria bacterium]